MQVLTMSEPQVKLRKVREYFDESEPALVESMYKCEKALI